MGKAYHAKCTECAYDRTFYLGVGADDADLAQEAIEYLSSGWRDMVNFCLRLSLADGLFEQQKPCLVLDDPFVYLDDAHAQAAQQLLENLAEEYQIVYFTCRE